MMKLLRLLTLSACCWAVPAFAEELAVCGASEGYAFYPKAGLAAQNEDAGKWVDDKISGGRLTLTRIGKDEYDLLFSDSTGRIVSAKQDGGVIVPAGGASDTVSLIVVYPGTGVVETYTFLRKADTGAEVIWTSNKGGGALIMKVAAYRADCSFFAK